MKQYKPYIVLCFVFLLIVSCTKPETLSWYSSGTQGIIASGDEQATRAGIRILKKMGECS